MTIPVPPISLALSTASKYLNLSSSTVPHRLHHQHCNAVAEPPHAVTKAALPKVRHNRRCCFMAAVAHKPGFFNAKKNSLANREHLGSPSMR